VYAVLDVKRAWRLLSCEGRNRSLIKKELFLLENDVQNSSGGGCSRETNHVACEKTSPQITALLIWDMERTTWKNRWNRVKREGGMVSRTHKYARKDAGR